MRLKTGFLARAGIQKRIEKIAHILKKGCCTEDLIFSKE
jgi:hypothetical protein